MKSTYILNQSIFKLFIFGFILLSPSYSYAVVKSPNVFVVQDDGTFITSGTTASDIGIVPYYAIDDRKIAEKFYSTTADIYDFLVIYTAFHPENQTPSSYLIKNTIQGIGTPVSGTIPPYPSQKLIQTIFMTNIDNFDINNQNNQDINLKIFFEEISHRWLLYFGDARICEDPSAEVCKRKTGFKINRDAAHWDNNVDSLVRENGKIYSTVQSTSGKPWQENNGYCTEQNIDFPYEVRFNSLELYLMGFIPPQETKPLNWYEFGETTNKGVKCTKKVLTVLDVINMVGPRNPAYPHTQKDFSTAFILITKQGQTPTSAQINKMNIIAKTFP